jgi:hypothetical protein
VLPNVLIPEGFEERSLGVLRELARQGRQVTSLGLVRYDDRVDLNAKYRKEFEDLAEVVAPGRWKVLKNRHNSEWVNEALNLADRGPMFLDISGLTTRGMFAAFDALRIAGRSLVVGYSEAAEYRPSKMEWDKIIETTEHDLDVASLLAETVDDAPWLYSGAHSVQLFVGHEGYDAAGVSALVAFLPFKPVRLGSLLDEHQFSSYVYVAGQPRLFENAWRLNALMQMNAAVIRQGRVIEMATFGYREALQGLAELICGSDGLLRNFDVHLAPMGSKLQNVACWILSTLVPAITVTASVPNTWHSEAYSDGVGRSWAFSLQMP